LGMPGLVETFEEIGQRHIENACELIKPAGADPVLAGLVFLHRLKREPDLGAELGLGHARLGTTQPKLAADMLVNRIGTIDDDRAALEGYPAGIGIGSGHHLGQVYLLSDETIKDSALFRS